LQCDTGVLRVAYLLPGAVHVAAGVMGDGGDGSSCHSWQVCRLSPGSVATSVRGVWAVSWAMGCAVPSPSTYHSCSDDPLCDSLQWLPAAPQVCLVVASRTRTGISTSCICQQMAGHTYNTAQGL
jgi:hypothetical protein